MKKLLFIMNPCAGTKKANRVLPEIISVFNEHDYEVITYMTAKQGDAARIAAQQGAGMDLVVCSGGDGTLNETVSGLLDAGLDVPVGYIPSGSTNDFASSLKLSGNPVQAAREIVEGTPFRFDVGRCGERYFSYVASFGIFTRASYATPQSVKNALGHLAYVLAGITELSQIRTEHVKLEIDGEVVEDEFLFGAISNSTSVGGILTLDPRQVDMSDGKFEILLLRAPRDLMEISQCITALQKQEYNCNMITFRSASQIRVYGRPEMSWTLDGEWCQGSEEILVSNLHHAVTLMKRETPNA